jgi:hypothetical protein
MEIPAMRFRAVLLACTLSLTPALAHATVFVIPLPELAGVYPNPDQTGTAAFDRTATFHLPGLPAVVRELQAESAAPPSLAGRGVGVLQRLLELQDLVDDAIILRPAARWVPGRQRLAAEAGIGEVGRVRVEPHGPVVAGAHQQVEAQCRVGPPGEVDPAHVGQRDGHRAGGRPGRRRAQQEEVRLLAGVAPPDLDGLQHLRTLRARPARPARDCPRSDTARSASR